MGQTGRVRFEITTGPETIYSNGFSDGELMSISCLSGFMCDLGDTGFLDGAGVFERLLSGTTVTEERFDPDPGAYLSGLVFDLAADTGRISFANDADVYGSAALNGTVFDWTNPWGQFDVGNFSRTQLIPNPLPAPVFLLGAAALPLVALRRRKMRR